MKILIDDYYEKTALYINKMYTRNQLFSLYIDSLRKSNHDISKAVKYLINKYNFIKIDESNNDTTYDLCIDTDTDIIYKAIS